MKIVDCEVYGNVVRYYYDEDNLKEWYGDDWDDTPWQSNAGPVYDSFVMGWIEVAYPTKIGVYTEPENCYRTGHCRNDFIARRLPLVILDKASSGWNDWDDCCAAAESNTIIKIYMGDNISKLYETGTVIDEWSRKGN